jgi:hypothetical protein
LHLLAALVGVVLFGSELPAADLPVRITGTQVGLPLTGKTDTAQSSYLTRFACWAPVYVEFELTTAVAEPAELAIETPDPDEIGTTLTVPLKLHDLPAGKRIAAADVGSIAYVRPAGVGEVTITVRQANGGKPLSEPFRVRGLRPRDPLAYVMLTLGPLIPGFELPRPIVGTQDAGPGLRGGRVEATEISSVNQLPDQWFAYAAADLVVLNTAPGSDEFLTRLFGEKASPGDRAKREALTEWVRRGGRLLVTVGANAELVSKLSALQDLLPETVNPGQPSRQASSLALSWTAREATAATSTLSSALRTKSGTFPIANLVPKPDRPARILIPTKERLKDPREAVAVQNALGLGRVTVVAFDLDRPPFTDLTERPEFWDWVLREGGANRASAGSDGKAKPGQAGLTEEEDEVAVALRSHTDTFESVPVISFGWVAVLIVLYILLIGPIEYYVLKRILGRLELTWITFPIIVLTVSLAAVFSARSLKGNELKINKLDVIDVDPASQRLYGTTWFTIFSPRIENYTLGVSPGEGWSAAFDPAGSTVGWVGAPRGGRASLLRRSYQYHPGENGLENVPIQVWSTKSFVANWSARLPADKPAAALVESRLEHPPADRSSVAGTFVNRLPIPVLTDCVAFYGGQAFPIPGGSIRAGETIRLIWDRGQPASQWLQKESRLEEVMRRVPTYLGRPGAGKTAGPPGVGPNAAPTDDAFPMWGVFFHESALTYAEGIVPRNASLRWLDQSWRLDPANRDEVILVGRVPPQHGPAEASLAGAGSPSRLWLHGVPGTDAVRTPLPGSGRQETWVRIFLPVKSEL